jgi:predicted transcriptional regulator YheO
MDTMDFAKVLVAFLGQILGKDTEIALQDLRNEKDCITAIVNGHVTGRKLGAPITELTKRMIHSGAWKTRDGIGGHAGKTPDGRFIRSSTLFIKDGDQLLGMLTINQDYSPYIDISQAILDLAGGIFNNSQKSEKGSGIQQNLDEGIQEALNDCNIHKGPGQGFSQAERMEIVEKLIDRDLFMIRGSVGKVARRLGCSVASLYRYIAMVNQKREEGDRDLSAVEDAKPELF